MKVGQTTRNQALTQNPSEKTDSANSLNEALESRHRMERELGAGGMEGITEGTEGINEGRSAPPPP